MNELLIVLCCLAFIGLIFYLNYYFTDRRELKKMREWIRKNREEFEKEQEDIPSEFRKVINENPHDII